MTEGAGAGGRAPAGHVLVVNDAAELQALLARVLEAAGCRVTLTTVAAAEPAAVARLAPDLVVIDVTVGLEARGWERVQLLKLDPATAAIPVVLGAPAGSVSAALEAHLLGLGIWPLPKPYRAEALLAAVARAAAGPPVLEPAARRAALRGVGAGVRLARRRRAGRPPGAGVPRARLRACRVEHAAGGRVAVLARLEAAAAHHATLAPFAARLRAEGAAGELRLVEEASGRVVARLAPGQRRGAGGGRG
jgi:CheY-like chemotaxis protein